MEELLIGGLAGGAVFGLLTWLNNKTATVHRVRNRMKGHKPARPMEYSGGMEKLQAYLKERDGG